MNILILQDILKGHLFPPLWLPEYARDGSQEIRISPGISCWGKGWTYQRKKLCHTKSRQKILNFIFPCRRYLELRPRWAQMCIALVFCLNATLMWRPPTPWSIWGGLWDLSLFSMWPHWRNLPFLLFNINLALLIAFLRMCGQSWLVEYGLWPVSLVTNRKFIISSCFINTESF